VEMSPNRDGRSMHRGLFTISYYLFKVLLAIFVTVIRKTEKPIGQREGKR
jgi:hypothetical protein